MWYIFSTTQDTPVLRPRTVHNPCQQEHTGENKTPKQTKDAMHFWDVIHNQAFGSSTFLSTLGYTPLVFKEVFT